MPVSIGTYHNCRRRENKEGGSKGEKTPPERGAGEAIITPSFDEVYQGGSRRPGEQIWTSSRDGRKSLSMKHLQMSHTQTVVGD